MEVALRDGGGGESWSLAERNAEINARRRAREGAGGERAVVVDRAARDALLARGAAAAAERLGRLEREEAERKQREGAAYRPREEREREARERRARAGESRGVAGWCNPARDYYKALGLERCCAAAEVRRAYKRLALTLHPDRHAGAPPDALEDLRKRFQDAAEAHDVLSDEERRASYDRLRDALESGVGGAGAPGMMTPEEQQAYMQGLRELAAMRRAAMKRSTKHAPLELEVRVSLAKLNRGHTKSVTYTRTSVDAAGATYEEPKTLHLVLRRGSYDGQRLEFPDEGSETPALLPGDVVVVLRQKPEKAFRRSGEKDLVATAQAAAKGDVYYARQMSTLHGNTYALVGPALVRALLNGGRGGLVEERLPLEGLYDPKQPYDAEPGDLVVRVFTPAAPLEDLVVRTCVRPRALTLVGSGDLAGPAAAAASALAPALLEALEAADMRAEERGAPPSAFPARAVLLHAGAEPSAAAAAFASALSRAAPVRWSRAAQELAEGVEARPLLDDEAAALDETDVVVVDAELEGGEDAVRTACEAFEACGARGAVARRHLLGSFVVGVGDGVALLGTHPADGGRGSDRTAAATGGGALLPHVVRRGGGGAGWSELHGAVATWPGEADVKGLGVMEGSVLVVEPSVWQPDGAEGSAEMLVAPARETLVATATAPAGAPVRFADEFDELDDPMLAADEGFSERCTRRLLEKLGDGGCF